MQRIIWQVIVMGGSVIFGSLVRAWQVAGQKAADKTMKMTIEEAKLILDVSNMPLNANLLQERFAHLIKLAEQSKHSSPYLLGKIWGARNRLEDAIRKNEKGL